MLAKILHAVNMAGFGLTQRISSAAEAVAYLGTGAIKSLVLSSLIFSHFNDLGSSGPRIFFENLWTHSNKTASYARLIARAEGLNGQILDDCFAAGLLHDIGKLILATNFKTQYQQALNLVRSRNVPLGQAEREVFGTTHAEVGAYLLSL